MGVILQSSEKKKPLESVNVWTLNCAVWAPYLCPPGMGLDRNHKCSRYIKLPQLRKVQTWNDFVFLQLPSQPFYAKSPFTLERSLSSPFGSDSMISQKLAVIKRRHILNFNISFKVSLALIRSQGDGQGDRKWRGRPFQCNVKLDVSGRFNMWYNH